ncbi:hypothetical protein ACLBR5_13440 [Escherichia coli]
MDTVYYGGVDGHQCAAGAGWSLVVGVAAFVGCVSMVSSNAMAVILDEFPIWQERRLHWPGSSVLASGQLLAHCFLLRPLTLHGR